MIPECWSWIDRPLALQKWAAVSSEYPNLLPLSVTFSASLEPDHTIDLIYGFFITIANIGRSSACFAVLDNLPLWSDQEMAIGVDPC